MNPLRFNQEGLAQELSQNSHSDSISHRNDTYVFIIDSDDIVNGDFVFPTDGLFYHVTLPFQRWLELQ